MVLHSQDEFVEYMINESTRRAQVSFKAAHYPHISQIHDLESQYADPDHPPPPLPSFPPQT